MTLETDKIGSLEIEKLSFDEVKHAISSYNHLADTYGELLATTQLDLEHEAYTEGEKRFKKALERAIERDEAASNRTIKPLLATLIPKVSDGLKEWLEYQCNHARYKAKAYRILTRDVEGKMWQNVDCDLVAVACVNVIISQLLKFTSPIALQGLILDIARSVETEMRYKELRNFEKVYSKGNLKAGLAKRHGAVYREQFAKTVEEAYIDKGVYNKVWAEWSKKEREFVGTMLIKIVIETTALIELIVPTQAQAVAGNECTLVTFAESYKELLQKRAGTLAGISPVFQPCVVPPKPWTGVTGGGYYATARAPLALVRVHSKKALRRYKGFSMPKVYDAINLIQKTPWRINKKVLEVAKEVSSWEHNPIEDQPDNVKKPLPPLPRNFKTDEKVNKEWRKAAQKIHRENDSSAARKLAQVFTLTQATKFSSFKSIYFPYNLDWRGRVYAVPQFNPQGDDLTKGLLTFSKGKPIGKVGFYWLKVHGANTAGTLIAELGVKSDKAPVDARIKWVNDNHENILKCAEDPLDSRWWCEMDSPYCFLAFCFEYAAVIKHGLSYVCSLPVALDGSCSGIQHLSAMLRDSVGGFAVNLVPSPVVQDIYNIVADKVNTRLEDLVVNGTENSLETVVDKETGEIIERVVLGTKALAQQWIDYGVNRSVTKRPVMTLAYGASEYGYGDQIYQDTVKRAIEKGEGDMFVQPFMAARFMATCVWEEVSSVVVAAVKVMEWLQNCAKLWSNNKNESNIIHWVAPSGFPVWQEYIQQKKDFIETLINGTFRLRLRVTAEIGDHNRKIDKLRQVSGMSPNFTHSHDAAHLDLTVLHANSEYDIEMFALIHDSFGACPADVEGLFKAVREAFVKMYEENDVLEDFKETVEEALHPSLKDKLLDLPSKGDLNIRDVLDSLYAFM